MDNQYIKIFNLNENYTLKQLKNALISKINDINNNNILNNHDKNLLISKYHQYYKILKSRRINNNVNQETLVNPNPFNNLHKLNSFFDYNINSLINNEFNSIINNEFEPNLINNGFYSSSYTSSSIIDNNGKKTVIQSSNKNINGKKENHIDGYIIDKNGNKTPIKFKNNKTIKLN